MAKRSSGRDGGAVSASVDDAERESAITDVERRLILDALAATDDDELRAAKLLGIGERTLWTKLERRGL